MEEEEQAEDSDDPFASPKPRLPSSAHSRSSLPAHSRARVQRDELDEEEEEEAPEEKKEHIPPKLLTLVMHECFKDKGVKIGKEANVAVGRYMDTFVREALARAAFGRAEGGAGGNFLEVEDLERLAPQLVLDF